MGMYYWNICHAQTSHFENEVIKCEVQITILLQSSLTSGPGIKINKKRALLGIGLNHYGMYSTSYFFYKILRADLYYLTQQELRS